MTRQMHASLTQHIPQPLPLLRPVARTVVRIDSGFIPLLAEERPTRVRPPIVTAPEPEHENPAPHYTPRTCLGCAVVFQPRSTTHRRCDVCGPKRRKALDEARKTTDRTRAPATRLSVKSALSVRAATRARARACPTVRKYAGAA